MMVPAADNPLEENLINETNEKESDFLSVLPVRSQSISSSVSSETTVKLGILTFLGVYYYFLNCSDDFSLDGERRNLAAVLAGT